MSDEIEASSSALGPRRRRRLLSGVLRIGVGAGLLAFLVAQTDTSALLAVLRRVHFLYAAGALGVIGAGIVVSTLRWRVFLRALGFPQTTLPLLRLYLAGLFFNVFLPTGVGGDVYKAYRVRDPDRGFATALGSVILDRVAGFVGLALIGSVAAVASLIEGDEGPVVLLALTLSVAVLAAASVLVLGRQRLRALEYRGRFTTLERLLMVAQSVARGSTDLRVLSAGLVGGVVFQGLVVAFHVLIAAGLGIDVGTAALACVIVVVSIASLAPITLNGVGIREGVYVWALGRYGVGGEEAFAFGLIILALLLVTGAVGGLVYILRGTGTT